MANQTTASNTKTSAIPAWKKRLPMQLTWGRMAICPLIVATIQIDLPWTHWLAATLFVIASVTDWLDGWAARKFEAQSNMGKFMDPIADKILVASALMMMVPSGRVGPILVLLLLARDILIGGIRAVAAADNLIIDAKPTGKWKTALQMVAIPAILIPSPFLGVPIYEAGLTLLWVSVGLSLISGAQYIHLYYRERKDQS
jgi:CDP-diacylglycerol--glycerol-3-phosphate 3-phosphatidyltransferase